MNDKQREELSKASDRLQELRRSFYDKLMADYKPKDSSDLAHMYLAARSIYEDMRQDPESFKGTGIGEHEYSVLSAYALCILMYEAVVEYVSREAGE